MTSKRDLVLWGATGAVGRRAAHHLALRTTGTEIRWAIGGRNREKLEAVKAALPASDNAPEIVVGDSKDRAFLADLAANTRVICSTVGPFALYGTELLEACVAAGAHYCDLTGEPYWMRQMIDAYQSEAEATGARIVHSCGHDSIPSDMGVWVLQKAALEQFGSPCPSVRTRITRMKGGFSGGTAASFAHAMEAGPKNPDIGRTMADPYALAPDGERDGPEPPDRMMPLEITYDPDLKLWTKPYFMAPMNAKTVRRSNALMGYPYGRDFHYEESDTGGPGVGGWISSLLYCLATITFLAAMRWPVTQRYLQAKVLPKSGEGPSPETRETGHYELVVIGAQSTGEVMKLKVTGQGDPGVESTSRMLVEAALCLADDADELNVGGGFWTPVSGLGQPLFDRLQAHGGLTFVLL
ncbi:MAG: saccharopine dehydrogenase NADP-binding domain-containing protein [Paracoccaceae bacterium]|nr:saccharopine dehydrogenase NADP-binding domain-containing protein [Paracoccaceae bacterium]